MKDMSVRCTLSLLFFLQVNRTWGREASSCYCGSLSLGDIYNFGQVFPRTRLTITNLPLHGKTLPGQTHFKCTNPGNISLELGGGTLTQKHEE